MPKKKKIKDSLDPFENLLNPFEEPADPKTKPRKRTTQTTPSPLATLIQEQRIQRNWTQRDLAERAQVGLRQISDIERGHMNVNYQTLRKILAVIGYELVPQRVQK